MGSVHIILAYVSVKQALKLIQQNIQNKKLALKLGNNKYYFLNDHTINKLMEGLIDENAVVHFKDQVVGGDVEGGVGDAEFVEYFTTIKTLELIALKPPKDKTKPGGGFFKHYHTIQLDLSRYAVYRESDEPDYAENCLVIAFREGGMSDEQLPLVKLFVMNRIIPTRKLKDGCGKLNFSIK